MGQIVKTGTLQIDSLKSKSILATDSDGKIIEGSGGSGTGDVIGPSSSITNNIPLFSDTSGKVLKDSGLTISGSNTGDNATNSQYSGLVTSKQDTLVSTTNIKSINGSSILGSGDLIVAGSGDVVGPASSVDNTIARFDSITGKLIQDSGITISDLEGTTYEHYDIIVSAQPTTDKAGRALILNASDGNGTGDGGDIISYAGVGQDYGGGNYMYGGQCTNSYGSIIEAGYGSPTEAGFVALTAGAGKAANADGGYIELKTGVPHGSGDTGKIWLKEGASKYGILDTSLLASTDKTFTFPNVTGTLTLESNTTTLTNKRITKRVATTTDDATAVIDIDACDVYELSAIANATEFTTTGTPTDGQTLMIRLKDAGAPKGLTWTGFTSIGVTAPATTVAGKWHYIGCVYNLAATAWHILAVSVQA